MGRKEPTGKNKMGESLCNRKIDTAPAVLKVGIPLIAVVCSHLDLKSGTPQPLMLRIQDLIDYLQFQFKAGLLPLSKSLKAYRLR